MADLKYLLYPPVSLDQQPDWPLLVFLHGSGERGSDLELVKRYGLPRELERGLQLEAYVAAPQCPAGSAWEEQTHALETLLEVLLVSHPIARECVSLTGFSMGGFGAWRWLIAHPHRFAGVMPVAGTALPAELFPRAEMTDALLDRPIWMVNGAADRHVSVRGADECTALLRARGARCRYTRYPDADHGETCRRAYADPELLQWLLDPRAPAPA